MGKLSSLTDDEFSHTFATLGPSKTASHYGVGLRTVYERRRRLEARMGRAITSPFMSGGVPTDAPDIPDYYPVNVKDGIVLVGSDLHIWPGDRSPALRAFIQFAKEYGPKAVILNGDVVDFPRISRHSPIGWESNPLPALEIEAAQEALHDIEQAAGRGVQKVWPWGNHDLRFETKIAQHCPEYALIKGVHLKDHFPNWQPCWLCFVNPDSPRKVAIKHRYNSGEHAVHNNTLKAGTYMITGHLHHQKFSHIRDYNGLRYGVETGTLANCYAKQFRNYTEENPRNWVSGFGVFTFVDGEILPPEFVTVVAPDRVAFRGKIIKV
jgi:UDP-2,3-diacylglucosamine pyrophosphatase LpxH